MKKVRPSMSPAAARVFGIAWLAIVAVMDGFVLYGLAGTVLAGFTRTAVEGVVISSEVERVSGHGKKFVPRVRYAYHVDGRDYQADRYAFRGASQSDGRYARRIVAEHPAGATVTVYARPGEPEDALLKARLDGRDITALLLFAPFNIIAFFLTRYAILPRAWRPRRGLRFETSDAGRRAYARLVVISRFESGLVLAGLLAMLLSVGLLFWGDPPLIGGLAAVVLSVGTAALVAKLGSGPGRFVLRIDHAAGELRLPREYGRNRPRIIPLSRMRAASVSVVDDEHHVIFQLDENETLRLPYVLSAEDADRVCGWLRERISMDARMGRNSLSP